MSDSNNRRHDDNQGDFETRMSRYSFDFGPEFDDFMQNQGHYGEFEERMLRYVDHVYSQSRQDAEQAAKMELMLRDTSAEDEAYRRESMAIMGLATADLDKMAQDDQLIVVTPS